MREPPAEYLVHLLDPAHRCTPRRTSPTDLTEPTDLTDLADRPG